MIPAHPDGPTHEFRPLRARRRMIVAAAVWVALFSLLLLRVTFLNDHFDRISRGRQMFAYGDTPFADFRDPGYYLTLYVSAAAQWWTGGGLLGEAIVTSGAIATAAAWAFLLGWSASGSLIVGLLAPLLMVLELRSPFCTSSSGRS